MAIDEQQRQLITALDKHGWAVVHRERQGLDWWAYEVWTLQSVWRPQGLQVYLTFLIDPLEPPMWEWVYLLSASLRPLEDRLGGERGPHLWLRRMSRELPSFLTALADLRMHAWKQEQAPPGGSNEQ